MTGPIFPGRMRFGAVLRSFFAPSRKNTTLRVFLSQKAAGICRTQELLRMSGAEDVPVAFPAPCPGALPVPRWVLRAQPAHPQDPSGNLSAVLTLCLHLLSHFGALQGHSHVWDTPWEELGDPCARGDFLTLFSSLPGSRSSKGHSSPNLVFSAGSQPCQPHGTEANSTKN